MTGRGIIFTVFLSLAWLGLAFSSAIPANAANAVAMPLTQLEQSGRVFGLVSQGLGRRLFPRSEIRIGSAPYIRHPYNQEWPDATKNERILLAEKIGNQGRARFAAERGWEKLAGSQNRGIPQGPDSVYWDSRTGKFLVLEAKGGSSPLRTSYGSDQGTNLNSIRSAEFSMGAENSTQLAKLRDAIVIRAAQRNRFGTLVTRTEHDDGMPMPPEQVRDTDIENVANTADEIEQTLTRQNPELAPIFKSAGVIVRTRIHQYWIAKGVAVLGLAGSAMIGLEAYQQSKETWAMWNNPSFRGTALPYLQTISTAGLWSESGTLSLGSAAQLGWLGQGGLSTFGNAAGRCFLPVWIGTEGFNMGYSYYKYTHGMISQSDFNRQMAGSGTFVAFTGVGAGIGAGVGVWVGGVGAVPTAAVGATVGAVVGSVAEAVEDIHWYFVDKHFDEQQRIAVDKAVDRYYGMAR